MYVCNILVTLPTYLDCINKHKKYTSIYIYIYIEVFFCFNCAVKTCLLIN